MLISNFPVVLDACVLYPRALRDTLLRAAERNLYTPYWSAMILDEVKRNLVAAGRLTPDRGDYLVAEMTRAFPSAAVVGFETLIPCMTNDKKDRHVSAAAVRARAEVIVTSNLRDFSDEALAPYGITAKAPDEFLLDLTSLSGRTMARIVREQLADIAASDPTATMDMLFEALTRHAPGFVDTIRSILDAQEAP